MTKSTMAKRATGVHLRTETNVYQWRLRVPKDLAHLYPGKAWADRRTLGTSNLAQANRLAAGLYATWLTTFDRQRKRLNPQPAQDLTPELIQFLTDTYRHQHLAADYAQRDSDISDWGRAEVAENLEEAGRLQEAVKWGSIEDAYPALQHFASEQGITISNDTPGINVALRSILAAQLDAASSCVSRDSGRLIPTPPAPELKKSAKVYYLRDIFDIWKKADGLKLTADSVRARERALELFEEFTVNTPIAQVTRLQGNNFKAWLQTKGSASKTVFERLTYVKSLLKYAYRELELIPKHPWDGITVEYETETPRKDWSAAEISAFFSQPLYTSYALPRLQAGSGADAGYWIPLIGLFSGARSAELCQLHVKDVRQEDSVWVIDINKDDDGKSLKNKASRRIFPVHSELVRLGFLDYAEATRKAGHKRLWPQLPLGTGRASGRFSRWFNEKAITAINGVEIPDFHSLRHTARTAMKNSPEHHKDAVTGHEIKGSVGTITYTHPTLEEKRTAVESIHYKDFNLARSYRPA